MDYLFSDVGGASSIRFNICNLGSSIRNLVLDLKFSQHRDADLNFIIIIDKLKSSK
jgi:hypothetical protein